MIGKSKEEREDLQVWKEIRRRKGRKAVRLFLSSVWFISLFLYKKEGGGGDTLRIFVM